jgi:hypothetical protein
VGDAELLGEHDTDLRESLIVRLQTCENQIRLLRTKRACECVGGRERIRGGEWSPCT